jgi:hypothetical protein
MQSFRITNSIPARSSVTGIVGNIEIVQRSIPTIVLGEQGPTGPSGTGGGSGSGYIEGFSIAMGKATFSNSVSNETVPLNSIVTGDPINIPEGSVVYYIGISANVFSNDGDIVLNIGDFSFDPIHIFANASFPIQYVEIKVYKSQLPLTVSSLSPITVTGANDLVDGTVFYDIYYK